MADEAVSSAQLTEHLKKALPLYMIPGVFIQLDSFKINANGKVDKKALPEPKMDTKTRNIKKPVTALQKKLCGIYASAIGIDEIGPNEDFFELGGTSLSASKVAMRCMLEKLPVVYANIFDYPTAEKLEKFINERQTEDIVKQKTDTAAACETDDVLRYNTSQYVNEIEHNSIGNVLLSGATGFLGIHVLKQLIDKTDKKIFCLVRKGKLDSAQRHLQMLLEYYYDNIYDELIGNRIIVIMGDITDKKLSDKVAEYDFDTIINCAACVKHFVNDDLLDRVNVDGVKNLIAICKKNNKRMIQVSTVSVAGEGIEGIIDRNKLLHENELYFGQELDNKYAQTKFTAEKEMLSAIKDGMKGKIIRVGNLMSRYTDGEFQINYLSNGFMKRLQAYTIIGKFPVDLMDAPAEFSPIDLTADAIIRLAGTNDKFTVFHAYNCHSVHMANVIETMNACGIKIDIVSKAEFDVSFNQLLADNGKNLKISSLISYMSNDGRKFFIGSDNSFTVKALYRLGYSWTITDNVYLEKTVRALQTLGFFG